MYVNIYNIIYNLFFICIIYGLINSCRRNEMDHKYTLRRGSGEDVRRIVCTSGNSNVDKSSENQVKRKRR